jgi:two-component system chemotaxis sensor kinase CheA
MDELLEQFLIEGRDLVADGQSRLAVLLGDPADARAIDGAFRAVHTLKGSVGIFDMAPAERVLHAAEELLERARKSASALGAEDIARLVATLDQVDRWIDEMEGKGALGPAAATIADALIAIDASSVASNESDIAGAVAAPDWAETLIARETAVIDRAEAGLTAFRYTPDRDAFFRGDDPLGLVATVPALVALAILPAEGAWPAPDAIDPFACLMIIEGLSGASRADLQLIFRLVPDQIAFHTIDRIADAVADTAAQAATTLRVDAARIDALADGVGELVVAANAFSTVADRADRIDRDLAHAIRAAQADLQRAVGAVRRTVSAVRLVPLAPTLRRLPRLVREIAGELGKQIDFSLVGDQAEVDKQIADGLFEPLLHLVRNALDHGIEQSETRAAAGKTPNGTLSLTITRDGEDLVVTLGDDGAGIDPARIRATAVARGLIEADAAQTLSDAAALGLIFQPGFSTAAQVSGVSGRGVGMDAVQAAVDRMRGRIEIDSRIGQGTRFILRLPANALTTRLLVVEVGHDRYAVPFDQIVETARVGSDRLMPLGTGTACVLRDRAVPVLSLAALLGGADSTSLPANLLVTRASGEPVALRVDGFSERIDAMVRRPSGLLAGVPSVAGTALMGDGGVLLVLNLPELVA